MCQHVCGARGIEPRDGNGLERIKIEFQQTVSMHKSSTFPTENLIEIFAASHSHNFAIYSVHTNINIFDGLYCWRTEK